MILYIPEEEFANLKPSQKTKTNNFFEVDIPRAANIYGLPVKIRFLRWLNGITHRYIKNYRFLMLKNVRFYVVN